MQELERLMLVSSNRVEMAIRANTVITSLNVRSLPKHIHDLQNDFKLMTAKIICLQETWCSSDISNDALQITGFNLHLVNRGRGKGIATYFKSIFHLVHEVNDEKFQLALFSSDCYHVINVYRSQGADTRSFIQHLSFLIKDLDNCFVVGDFNVDSLTVSHSITNFLLSQGYKQLVKFATHEHGSLLDHAFIRSRSQYDKVLHWPYYSDHAAVCIAALV